VEKNQGNVGEFCATAGENRN